MAMAMNLGASGKRGPDINVTPLIDVLLVLLIIFMVLTPFHPMGEKALIAQPPEKTPVPDIVQPRIVVLQMAPDQSGFPALRLNGQATNWSDLQAQLQTIYKDRVEKNMFVRADETLDWDPVAQAIGIAHNAGVVNVGLITTRIEQARK
jgi:biopolymer transport protein ExbD/biopolymer transport protein TolR